MLLVGFPMIDGRSMNWLSGLHIAAGREYAGSSVLARASLFHGRLWFSGHKTRPLPHYHDNVIGIGDQVFIFDAEQAADNFVPPESEHPFERRRQRTPTKSNKPRNISISRLI